MAKLFKSLLKKALGKNSSGKPRIGKIDFGDFRRLSPLSREFGYDRGGPIDRYYIERFLGEHSKMVKGKVMEVKDGKYAKQFGGNKIKHLDILDIDNSNTKATLIADLSKADQLPSNEYDCVILTQTLQFIYEVEDAVKHVHRILKPGGTLLMTVPGITQILYKELGETWFWNFTETSIKTMLYHTFEKKKVDIKVHGNVLVASALLYGVSAKELKKEELDHKDPDYPVLITVKARK